ncbi:uncharacterized protein LOC126576246 [Anopheles aquasalis]|uniref:uncharacterized protein LOC126576246 n=1 Tax=Anopheles aquasalis TaxID=42839 RepID=UPI00215AC5A2|nr:uncharacterized protein LOC126576246 [Anopheles aquasalis]
MNRDLCDETFPSSLLIAFDDLSDEIPVSPEPVLLQPLSKQMEQHIISTTSVATTTASITTSTTSTMTTTTTTVTVGNLSDEGTGNRTGSRMIVSGSSNTSSGHSSLSTDGGGNRSASSERDSSRDEHGNRSSMPPSFVRTTLERPSQLKTDSKAKLRQPRSLENLLQLSTNNHPKPLNKDTGSLKLVSGSINSSSASSRSDRYLRHRNNKYAHVPSKVKQQIDQLKSLPRAAVPANGDRKTLVRHKSMPETVSGELLDENEALEQENSLPVLRTMVRELRLQLTNMQQLHDFYQAKQLEEMDGLRYKNDFLRMENDRLMELERCREQQRQLARSQQQQQSGGSCYGSRSSLHKVHATSSVACQTSPTVSFELDHFSYRPIIGEPGSEPPESPRARATSSPTASGTTRLRRSTRVSQHHRHHHPVPSFAEDLMDSPELGEFSPDYEQLIPSLGRVGRDRSNASLSFGTVYLPDGTDRLLPAAGDGLEENFDQDDFADQTGRPLDRTASNASGCRDCRRRKRKKRKTRRQKLASLFCLRRHDESI